MPVPWDDDRPSDAALLLSNVARVLRGIADDAGGRLPPAIDMARQWHRELYRGADLPVSYYAGEVRDSDPEFPELIDYEVRVGRHLGVFARDVPAALVQFEYDLADAVAAVDGQLLGRGPIDATGLQNYVTLTAVAYGEWLRIHPFANGNGRTARLWTHWLAARYDLMPLLAVKPRPDDELYADAASASMTGDHRAMRAWLLDRLERGLRRDAW